MQHHSETEEIDLEPAWLAEGSFSFRTLLCELLQNDVGLGTRKMGWDEMSQLYLSEIGRCAERFDDAFPLETLWSSRLPKATQSNLLHERIHYWQYISSTHHQLRFLTFLEEIAAQLMLRGGDYYRVCGFHPLNQLPREQVSGTLKFLEDFKRTIDAETNFFRFCDGDVLAEKQWEGSEVRLAELRIPTGNGKAIPAYGAIFPVGNRGVARVPFTILPLMESAATLVQSHFMGEALPIMQGVGNIKSEQLLYYGAWEFWKRVLGERHTKEEDLVASFLAAVDLVLSATNFGPLDPMQVDPGHIGTLFAKVAGAATFVKPFRLDGNEPRIIAAKFQEEVCEYLKWPTPAFTASRMAAWLTKHLAFGMLMLGIRLGDAGSFVQPLLAGQFWPTCSEIDALRPLWDRIPTDGTSGALVGMRVLSTMLNACYDRIRYPGIFAIPQYNSEELSIRYKLPFVLFNGSYFSDTPLSTNGNKIDLIFSDMSNLPCKKISMSVGGDCVSLLALSRLRDGDVCGFRTARTNTPICQYTINGIGCPQAGLSPQQVDIRKKFGIDDWCHWTYWSLATRIATSSTQKEWDNRFAKNGVVA